MAGAGYKLFNTGDVLTAAQVNTYLQEQAVMRFANATARTTALSGVLAEGMMSYLDDTNSVEVYNGSAWVSVGSTGDITGVTAGTGISGGGTSGDVTITNSMATAIDAKGDLIAGTGADTFSRLAVGSNNTVLTADSTTATGLKWAAVGAPSFSGVRVFNSTALTLTNGAYTQLTFNSESYDTDGYHSTTTNTARLTPPSGKGGYFYVWCFGQLQQTGNAIEAVMRLDNSSSEFARANIYYGTAGAPTLFCSTVQYISDTDYIVANVYINTNANKNFEISGTYGQFGMVRLGA